MAQKLTKKERGRILMNAPWTDEELSDPAIQELRRRLEEEERRREELARNPFSNVQSEADTVPAAPVEEQSGLSSLLDGLGQDISRNQEAHRDAFVGGGKRSLGAGMLAAEEHGENGVAGLLRGVYETLNLEGGGLSGFILRNAFAPEQVQDGATLFKEGSKQVADAYDASQKNTSWLGKQGSGAMVDILGSPSSAASLVGGPAGMIAGLDTYAQEYASGRAAGLTKEEADSRAAIHGGIEGGVSSIPTGKVFQKLVPSGVRRELMGTVSRIVANVGATAGAEAAEEVATTAAQLLADKALARGDGKVADFANSNLPKDSAGVAEALWRSARAGALMGGGIKTPGALLDAAMTNAQHAAQIIASGEQAAAERDQRRSTKIEPVTPQELEPSTPVQRELFGGESTPFTPVEAPVAPSKPKVDLGPDLFPEARSEALRSRAEASKLIDKEQKNIQAKAKSSRAAARRSFLTKLTEDTRNLPREQRIETIARATEQWDFNNPLEGFVTTASQSKTKGRKGKKSPVQKSKDVNVNIEDLLAKFDGLQQKSVEDPSSDPASNSGAIEHVFRTMVKKVGKGDVKVLNKLMQDGNLKVVEDESFLPGKGIAKGTKGYYDGNTTYIVAKNLDQDNVVGDMLSVAAHETKHAADVSGNETVKASVRGLIGDKANANIVSKIEALGRKDPEVGRLVQVIKEDISNPKVYQLELPAYFINHALDKRSKSFLVKRVMDDVASAVITGAKKKLGIEDVSLEDIGYLSKQLLKETAISGERLTGDVSAKIKGDGLEMIGGRKGAGYNQALSDDRVYIGHVDKKPRFEFSDHESKLNRLAVEVLRRKPPDTGMRLDSVLEHSELYKQYPQLASYVVKIDPNIGTPSNNANGYFRGGNNKMLAVSPDIAKNDSKLHTVLLHEIQHAIQEIEGHDPGASPKQFESRQVRDSYNEARAIYNDFLESFYLEDALDSLPSHIRARWVAKFGNTQSTGNPSLDKEAIHNFLTGDWVNWASTYYRDKAQEYKFDLAQFNEATKKLDDDKSRAFDKYRAVYGETEARTTELRRNLTPEERELITPEEDMKYAAGKIPVENTTPSPKTEGVIEESVDDSFEERQNKKKTEEAVRKMREAGRILETQSEAEDDNDVANDDVDGLAFLPRKYTVGNTAAKEALRVAERLLWSGGFVNSALKELTLHASHLPASLMVKATKYGNDMLNAIDHNAADAGKGKSADEQRKIRQRLRVDLGKEIERIDSLETKAARDAALDALDRNPRFKGIGQAVRSIRDFKMELTREIIALRSRNPKPMTEKEVAIYNKMIENAERYTTRAYLATYNDKIGLKYGKNLWKRFERDPDSLEGKIVQRALDFLQTKELIIPDEDSIHSLGTAQLRRMYENWIGSTTSLKGDKGRRKMIRDLLDLPEKTKEEIDAKAVEIVKDMLNLNKNKGISARFYSIGAKQNRTILEARTDMPPELRALMGEITDPFLREAISLQRMINLSAKTKLLTEVFEAGASRNWWSDTKTDDHETQLNDIAYGPLNGKWINRDLEDALTGTVMSLESTDKMIADSIHNPTAFSQYLAGKSVKLLTGLSRVQKTYRIVFSFAQMGFNAGGAFMNAMGVNGILNPATLGKGAKDALLVLTSEINSKVINEKNLPTIQEIVRAGVIDSATVGEFKSQAYQNITEQIQKLDPDQPGYAQKTMQVFWNYVSAQGDIPNAVRQIYAYMDVWTKVATYHDRKNFLTEYNKLEGKGWTEEQIQRRAGYEASGTNISYERAIPLAKIIEKNLPFGMFLTYFSEVPRTIGTSYIQAAVDARMAMDAKNPKAKALATTKAVTRFLGTTAAGSGVIAATLAALDSDDEEEKKRRRLDPEWMRNKFTLPIGLDEEGHVVLFETNRFDPNGPLNEALVAVLSAEEDKRAEAVYNQVLGLFVPAQGAIAVYRTLHDMAVEAAARATGNASLYEMDMRSKRTVMERNYPEQFAKLKRVLGYGDFGENIVATIEQLWLPASAQPLVDQKGKVVIVRPQDTNMENVPQGLGYRPYVRNPDESFDFRIRDYNNSIKEIMKDRAKLIRDADKLDESTLISELSDLVGREKEAFEQLRYNYEGYMAYEDKTLQDAARHFDSKKLFAQVRYNRFQPRTVSSESLRDWARQQVREGRDREEVRKVYNLLRRIYTETGE